MKYLRCIRLFLGIVWRHYTDDVRIGVRTAWDVAKTITL